MAMTLRLTPEQDRALTLLAEAQGSSKQEAAVRAIVTAANRLLNDARVSALARDVVEQHTALESRIRQARD
ncbi:MAG TPA: CopG family transcriptional regulator [Corynebacterium sp.]|nr:CopG family transcriptional regulator [Corynebacterium sp.]